MLNDLVDSAQLLPNCINGQVEKLQGTIQGTEEVLIYDPISGALRKAKVQNLIASGIAIETNYIEGAQYGGQTGVLSIVSSEGFYLANTDTSNANAGVNISSNGGNLSLNATNSGYGHGNGLITVSSGSSGIDFLSFSTGTARFAQRTLFNTTGAIKLPVGTTAQRPATPVAGDLRFNSTVTHAEVYDGSVWEILNPNPVQASSLTGNGYVKLIGGLTLQWGTTTILVGTYGASTVTFPVAFTTTCFNVQITLKTQDLTYSGSGLYYENSVKLNGNPTTTGFGYSVHYGGSVGSPSYANWFAIGI
jgi:hypothetical protein